MAESLCTRRIWCSIVPTRHAFSLFQDGNDDAAWSHVRRLLGILMFLILRFFPTSTVMHALYFDWMIIPCSPSRLAFQVYRQQQLDLLRQWADRKLSHRHCLFCASTMLLKSLKDHRLSWFSLPGKVHADDFWTTVDSQTWLVVPVHSIIAATFILAERSECI